MKRTALKRRGRRGAAKAKSWQASGVNLQTTFVGCQVQAEKCTYRATDKHHRKPRSRGGEDTWMNRVYCCASCHRWIHEHPAAAAKAGFLDSVKYEPTRATVDAGTPGKDSGAVAQVL